MKKRNRILSILILTVVTATSYSNFGAVNAQGAEEKIKVNETLKDDYVKEDNNAKKEDSIEEIKDPIIYNKSNISYENKIETQELKVSVLSDIHYFSSSMIKECEDFIKAKNKDRKLLEESSAILDSSLEKIKEEKPDVLLISGDLTKDGEKIGHEEVARKLKTLQQDLKSEGKDLKIYVINGNHDINNSDAKDFSLGRAVAAQKTSVSDFKNIYKDFCYDKDVEVYNPSSGQAGSLSYVVSPKPGYTIIAVDSCKYSKDVTSSKTDEHETSGTISNELKKWVTDKAKTAKSKGDTVILLQHHGLVPHFDEEPKILGAYLVDNYESINKEFAKAGIKYAFTGHMHSNDISKLTLESGEKLYDIETGSAVTYPCPLRNVIFTKEKDGDKIAETVKVNTKLISSINYIDKTTGKEVNDLTNYSYEKCINQDFFKENAQDYSHKYLNEIKAQGGLYKYLSNKLNDDFGDYVIEKVRKYLPKNLESAMDVKGVVRVYYDMFNKRIVIKGKSFYKKGTLYITDESIRKNIVEAILYEIDSKILENSQYVNSKVSKAVTELLNTNIYCQNSNDKNVLDLFNYVYFSNLAGDERSEVWVDTCAEEFKNKNNINLLLKVIGNNIAEIINDNAKELTYNANSIISRESGLTSTIMRIIVVKLLGNDLGDIIKLTKLNVNEKVNDTLMMVVNENKRQEYGDLVYRVIRSMLYDTNYKEDNNTIIKNS